MGVTEGWLWAGVWVYLFHLLSVSLTFRFLFEPFPCVLSTFPITLYLPTLSTSLSFDTRVLLDSAWLFSAGRLGARVQCCLVKLTFLLCSGWHLDSFWPVPGHLVNCQGWLHSGSSIILCHIFLKWE